MFISKDILSIVNNTLELQEPVRDMNELATSSFIDMEELDLSDLEYELDLDY